MKYRSKIGIGIVLFISLVLGFVGTMSVINNSWQGALIVAVVAIFVLYIMTSFVYIIDNGELRIKGGMYLTIKIPIDRIRKIEETNNPLSSPAASLDRIAIYYNNFNVVMISPREKKEFIDHLLSITPRITVRLKKDRRNWESGNQ